MRVALMLLPRTIVVYGCERQPAIDVDIEPFGKTGASIKVSGFVLKGE